MTINTRRMLFSGFFVFFIISAPLIVLYTAGYRYSISQKRIVKTGLISTDTIPSGAEIYLNGKDTAKRTSTILDTLLPSKYVITFQKAGYMPWEQQVTVESGKTTFLNHVVLFLDINPIPTTYDPTKQTDTKEDTQQDNTIFTHAVVGKTAVSKTQNGKITVIAYLPTGDYRFLPSPNGYFLAQHKASNQVYLIDRTATDQPILLSAQARLHAWEISSRPRLLYSDGFDLHIYDPVSHQDKTVTRLGAPVTALSWHPSGSVIFYAQADRISALDLYEAEGKHVQTKLASGTDIENLQIDEKGETLYFKGTIGDQTGWFERKLVE